MNEELIINDLLQEIISHSSRCAHCKYLRQENDNCYCFFAYACLTQDFYYWDYDL